MLKWTGSETWRIAEFLKDRILEKEQKHTAQNKEEESEKEKGKKK